MLREVGKYKSGRGYCAERRMHTKLELRVFCDRRNSLYAALGRFERANYD